MMVVIGEILTLLFIISMIVDLFGLLFH